MMIKLKPREKRFVLIGGILLFVILSVRLYYLPFFDRMRRAQELLPQKRLELKRVIALGEDWQRLRLANRQLLESLKSKQSRIISYSLLEELATKIGIRSNLKSIRPRSQKEVEFFKEETLEISLVNVTLEQITRYLYEIEATDPTLQTSRIHLQPTRRNSELLKADFTISIFNEGED